MPESVTSSRGEEIEMLAAKNPVMKKAVGVLKKLSSDERARLLYESREKARRDEISRLHGARAEGEAIGRAEGEAIGMAKGEAIGRSEGRAEEKREMAKQMLARGMDIAVICELTGFSEDDIRKST